MKLTVSAIQFSPRSGDVSANLKRIEELLCQAASVGSELAVLPEVCDSGYDITSIGSLTQESSKRSADAISEMARKHKVAVVAGLAERRKDGIYNTALFFDKNGKVVASYDKTHLCPIPPFNEPELFKKGKKIFAFEYQGVKLGMSVCYDNRFPEVYRKLALDGALLVLHPTAFPRSRIEHHEIVLRARAIENQFFIVAANFVGKPRTTEFGGRSMIIAPDGKLLARADDDKEAVITKSIDLDDVERFRREQPIFSQRRPELC